MAGLALSFEQDRITVGAAANRDMRLSPPAGADDDDSPVAPEHAEILFDDDERIFYLHDIAGRRGTLVNGERPAEARTPLYVEDVLQFGAAGGPELIFRLGMAAPGLQPLPPEPEEAGSLEFLTGVEAGRAYPVPDAGPVRIGRRADLEIALDPQGDLVVSGNHCAVERTPEGFTVTDTSRNGTFVNDTAVEGTAYLDEGDILRLGEGGPRIRFRASAPRRVYPNLAFRTGATAAAPRKAGDIPQSRPVAPPAGGVAAAPAVPAMPPHMTMPPAHRGDRIPAAPPQRTPKVPCKINLLRHRPAHGAPHRAMRQATVWWRTLLHDKRRRRPGLATRITRDGSLLLVAGVAAAMGYGLWRLGTSGTGAPKRTTGSETAKAAAAAAETLARQMATAGEFKVAKGAYTIAVPAGWRALENGRGALLEPPAPDTGLAVDFMRDARLKPDSARRLAAGAGGEAKAYPLPRAAANGEVAISAWGGRSGDLARIAVFHQPPGDVPLLAMLETTTATLAALPADTLDKLLVSGVKMQRINPLPTPTPTQKPKPKPAETPEPGNTPTSGGTGVAGATATPGATAGVFGIKLPFGLGSGSATPKPAATGTAAARPTPATDDPAEPTPRPIATTTPRSGGRPTPTPTARPTAAPEPDAEPTATTTPAAATARVANRKAKLALRLPEKWSGTSDEAEGTLAIKSPAGLSVRVARDAGKVEVEGVARGLVLGGYTMVGQPMKKAAYSAAILRKGDDRMMVTLIPQTQGTDSTVVVLSTMEGAAISPEDNKALGALVGQIIDAGKPAAR